MVEGTESKVKRDLIVLKWRNLDIYMLGDQKNHWDKLNDRRKEKTENAGFLNSTLEFVTEAPNIQLKWFWKYNGYSLDY